MSSLTLLNIAMLMVIFCVAIAIRRVSEDNKLLHEMNRRERMHELELSGCHGRGKMPRE